MNTRKILSGILAAATIFSSTACTGNQTPSTSNAPADTTAAGNATSENANTEGEDDFSDLISISVGSFELNTVDVNGKDDEIYLYIKDKFNVEITPVTINWDTWSEQINTMLASDDLPDMARYDLKAETYGTFTKMMNQGALRGFTIDGYSNLEALREKLPISEAVTQDGQMYAWPSARQDNAFNANTSLSVIYRRDWAKKVGLYKENDEYTLDEFVELCRAFRDQDPAGNGAGKTVAYAEVGWGFGHLFQAFNPYNAYAKVDGKYVWNQTLPGAVEGLEFYNMLYKEKLYYQDFYAAQDYDARSMFYANLVGIYMDNFSLGGLYGDIMSPFASANPGVDVYEAVAMMYIKGKDGKFFTGELENTWSATIFSPHVDEAKMSRILAMMDYAVTEDGLYHYKFGVEGKDWVKDGDGVKVLWEKDENGEYIQPAYDFSQFRDLACLGGDFAMVNPNIPDVTKEMIKTFQQKFTDQNANIIRMDYYVDYLSTPEKDKYGTFGIDTKAEQQRLVVSDGDVKEQYQAWIDSMMPKVQGVLDEINASIS